jgi:hypothetical protein
LDFNSLISFFLLLSFSFSFILFLFHSLSLFSSDRIHFYSCFEFFYFIFGSSLKCKMSDESELQSKPKYRLDQTSGFMKEVQKIQRDVSFLSFSILFFLFSFFSLFFLFPPPPLFFIYSLILLSETRV